MADPPATQRSEKKAIEHEGQTGVYFDSGGHRLLGTLFLAQGDEPGPTAVILHGVPGIEKNYDLAHALRDHGWNSLIFHYRGCWGSERTYALKTIPHDVHAKPWRAESSTEVVILSVPSIDGGTRTNLAGAAIAARDPRR